MKITAQYKPLNDGITESANSLMDFLISELFIRSFEGKPIKRLKRFASN